MYGGADLDTDQESGGGPVCQPPQLPLSTLILQDATGRPPPPSIVGCIHSCTLAEGFSYKSVTPVLLAQAVQ